MSPPNEITGKNVTSISKVESSGQVTEARGALVSRSNSTTVAQTAPQISSGTTRPPEITLKKLENDSTKLQSLPNVTASDSAVEMAETMLYFMPHTKKASGTDENKKGLEGSLEFSHETDNVEANAELSAFGGVKLEKEKEIEMDLSEMSAKVNLKNEASAQISLEASGDVSGKLSVFTAKASGEAGISLTKLHAGSGCDVSLDKSKLDVDINVSGGIISCVETEIETNCNICGIEIAKVTASCSGKTGSEVEARLKTSLGSEGFELDVGGEAFSGTKLEGELEGEIGPAKVKTTGSVMWGVGYSMGGSIKATTSEIGGSFQFGGALGPGFEGSFEFSLNLKPFQNVYSWLTGSGSSNET